MAAHDGRRRAAAEHPRKLVYPRLALDGLHRSACAATFDRLPHGDVPVGIGRALRKVRYRDDLRAPRDEVQLLSHGARRLAADVCIHLVEDKRPVGVCGSHDLHGEHHPRGLAGACNRGKWPRGLAWVRLEHVRHSVASVRLRLCWGDGNAKARLFEAKLLKLLLDRAGELKRGLAPLCGHERSGLEHRLSLAFRPSLERAKLLLAVFDRVEPGLLRRENFKKPCARAALRRALQVFARQPANEGQPVVNLPERLLSRIKRRDSVGNRAGEFLHARRKRLGLAPPFLRRRHVPRNRRKPRLNGGQRLLYARIAAKRLGNGGCVLDYVHGVCGCGMAFLQGVVFGDKRGAFKLVHLVAEEVELVLSSSVVFKLVYPAHRGGPSVEQPPVAGKVDLAESVERFALEALV